jgi:hypothetical protein
MIFPLVVRLRQKSLQVFLEVTNLLIFYEKISFGEMNVTLCLLGGSSNSKEYSYIDIGKLARCKFAKPRK